MEIPTHLSHKPIVKLEEYSQLDGRFKNKTDAEGLSIGLAQWNSQRQYRFVCKSLEIHR